MKQLIVIIIEVYQRFISPRKNFCCAYRVVNGGKSCSEYGKYSISKFGVFKGFKLLINRFQLCGKAYKIAQTEPKEEKERKDNDDALNCFLLEGAWQIGCCALISTLG